MPDIRVSVSPEGRRSSGGGGPTGPAGPEGLAGVTGPAGPVSPPPVIAGANINSAGALVAAIGVSAVVHSGTGVFLVTLTNPPADMTNAGVLALPFAPSLGVSGQVVHRVVELSPDQLEIDTFDAAGTAADRSFSLVVYDLTT